MVLSAVVYRSLLEIEYRPGHWAEAIAAAERAMGSRSPHTQVNVCFILAVAHWHRGDRVEAAGWFEGAVAMAKRGQSIDSTLYRLWTEAAELLGQTGTDAGAADRG
jgi:hypothetical protein